MIRTLYVFIVALMCVNVVSAQVSVNSSGGIVTSAVYPDLKAAFDTINSGYQTGVINIVITGNFTQATTARLDSSGRVQAWGASSYTSINIYPSGGAWIISGAVPAGSSLIHFNGADNVTINGLNNGTDSLVVSNTTASSTSGTCTILFSNDATNNIIRRTTVLGAAIMSTTTNGGTIFFSTAVTGGSGNDNNTITNCFIANNNATNTNFPYKHIYINGSTTNAAMANSGILIDSNKFVNFRANGVYSNTGVRELTIRNNHFYHTAVLASSAIVFAPVWVSNSTSLIGEQFNITGNYIGGSAPFCGGAKPSVSLSTVFQTIYLNCATTAPSYINGNTIANLSITTTSTTVSHSYIFMNSGRIDCGTQRGNLIGSTTDTSNLILIYSNASASNFNAFGCAGANTTPTFDTIKIENNTFAGFSIRSTSTSGISMRFFDPTGATGLFWVRYNTFGSPVVANSIRASMPSNNCFGFLCRNSSSGNVHQFVGNYFGNISFASTAGGNLTGISLNNATNWRVDSNVFENFSNYSTSAGVNDASQLMGILFKPSGLLGSSCIGNTVRNFRALHPSVKTNITGMSVGGTPTIANTTVAGNKIQRLYSLSSDTVTHIGLLINSDPVQPYLVHNNEISLGIDSAGNDVVNGHFFYGIQRMRGQLKCYYNSVSISGMNAGNAASTYAMFTTDTGGVREFKNNVFSNTRSFAIAGLNRNYAASISGTINSGVIPGLISNYNLYYAPNIGGALIGNSGIDYNSIVSWNSVAPAHDGFSVSGNPNFTSPNRLQGQAGTAITVGDPSAGVNIDILGNTRVIYLMGAYDITIGLPVKYTYTNAVKYDEDVRISWITATETNNKGFAVERATDGIAFSEIQFVTGMGSTNVQQHYALVDSRPFELAQASVLYYRFKQVDFDGKFQYSRVMTVAQDETKKESMLFPNPFHHEFSLSLWATEAQSITVSILDIHGKEWSSQRFLLQEGSNLLPIEQTSMLPTGIYMVKMKTIGGERVRKIVKL